MTKKQIYLDYAAATPLDEAARAAMEPYLSQHFYNPSAAYQAARTVQADLEAARQTVASVLGARQQEVIFTAGGTEANNLAIHGVMSQYPEGHMIISGIEHESVIQSAQQYNHSIAPVDKRGIVDISALEALITEKTVLISVMYANNEIGTIQPLKAIAGIIQNKRAGRTTNYPLYFHTDACQAANYLDLHVSRLGVDLVTLNGGKIYAMKQSGALYVRRGITVRPQITGGKQEQGLRSGTENVAAVVSFATMLQKVQTDRKRETERLQQIRNIFIATLSQNIPTMIINGHQGKKIPNNLNIAVPGVDAERLLLELDEAGIMVATGSACTASNDAPSHVLRAIGLSDQTAAASLRISLGRQSSETEAKEAATRMAAVIHQHLKLI